MLLGLGVTMQRIPNDSEPRVRKHLEHETLALQPDLLQLHAATKSGDVAVGFFCS